ncbi:hypothetical protein FOVG_09772 [Fusarium oxysporum f. sp. pisi HDV247]|uniref:2EXR domain-containing protein n=1 Tax=Fusarium oxysporum f. sp. pisi HDV247 TaxID=1080344 RepID=W9PG93_FUSOX|nr:hypothetical protein FOVG_09772 [Fusarium oxysporum f. sp. pisi HDV247]
MANFQNHPPEIRHEIYLLATPARVVHLKAEFVNVDECHTLWRVSSYQGAFCHWRQSKNYENRVRVYFYSNAPIPVLLHTCFESRDFLIKMGYQLALKTKSHGPRTWFNYDRDVLFKDENTCDVAQFDPGDAIRVRRLAIGGFSHCLYEVPGDLEPARWHNCHRFCLYPQYKEFTALEELLVVDWTRNAFPRGLTRDTGYPAKPPPKRHRYDTGNLWKCVKVEETSLLRTMYHYDPREESHYGPKIDKPRGYGPAPNIADWGTFGTRSAYLQLELVRCWKSQNGSAGEWRAPRITLMHLIDERQEEILQQKQKMAVDELRGLQEYWAPALKERKERIDAGVGVISSLELRYLWANRWEKTCWIEKDIFS